MSSGGGGSLGLGEDDGLSEAEGEIDALGEMDALGLSEALGLGLRDSEAEGLTLGLIEDEGDSDEDGDSDGDCDELGLREALGLTEGDTLLDGLTEAEGEILGDSLEEGETLALGLTDGLALAEGLADADGDKLALGLWLALGDTEGAVTSSSIACEANRVLHAAPNGMLVPVNPEARTAVSSATVSLMKLVSCASVQPVGSVVVVSALPRAVMVMFPVSAGWSRTGSGVPAA